MVGYRSILTDVKSLSAQIKHIKTERQLRKTMEEAMDLAYDVETFRRANKWTLTEKQASNLCRIEAIIHIFIAKALSRYI